MFKNPFQHQLLVKAELVADEALRRTKALILIPIVIRLCLTSTFFEDGVRMYMQWDMQTKYINLSFDCGELLASGFVLTTMLFQLVGCFLALLRWQVPVACGLLLVVVVMQIIAYEMLWKIQTLLRILALVGSILLMLAESRQDRKSLFAGVPTLEDNKPKNYMQFTGRILLVFMFATLLKLDYSLTQILQNVVGSALIFFVVVGYKTKLCALMLVIWLTVMNFYLNSWWTVDATETETRDFLKYDFFQTLSVIGGLMTVVSLGPGNVSIDKHKKNW